MLVTTHQLEEAEALCHRIGILNDDHLSGSTHRPVLAALHGEAHVIHGRDVAVALAHVLEFDHARSGGSSCCRRPPSIRLKFSAVPGWLTIAPQRRH